MYYSNKILGHGLGSKVLKMIIIMGWVMRLNADGNAIQFVYTPLNVEGYGVDFNANELYMYTPYGKTGREAYLEVCTRWEAMIGYKGLRIDQVNDKAVEFFVHPTSVINAATCLELYNYIHSIRSVILDSFSLPIKEIKPFIDVAIHIRRGDVTAGSHPDRWIPDEYYVNVIEQITSILGSRCKITIYTQRANFNVELFKTHDISYDDETDDNVVWLKLVQSDILVMGRSAFSYSAGLLHTGQCVVYYNMFHPKLSNWYDINAIEPVLKRI